jgi:hypothetical protein
VTKASASTIVESVAAIILQHQVVLQEKMSELLSKTRFQQGL